MNFELKHFEEKKWRSYKTSSSNQENHENGSNWFEWEFEKNGNAKFLLTRDNKYTTDSRVRKWAIVKSDKVFLEINNKTEYEITELNETYLTLMTETGVRHHFTTFFNWLKIMSENNQ